MVGRYYIDIILITDGRQNYVLSILILHFKKTESLPPSLCVITLPVKHLQAPDPLLPLTLMAVYRFLEINCCQLILNVSGTSWGGPVLCLPSVM